MMDHYFASAMWSRTAESLPPRGKVLAVAHKLSSRGEYADEEATWHGDHWIRRRDSERLEPSYYYLWRALET